MPAVRTCNPDLSLASGDSEFLLTFRAFVIHVSFSILFFLFLFRRLLWIFSECAEEREELFILNTSFCYVSA